MYLPRPRGTLSDVLVTTLRTGGRLPARSVNDADDAHDAALALWCLYELHYRGFDDAAEDLEWRADLIAVRRDLEHALESRLRERHPGSPESSGDFAEDFFAMTAAHDGRSVAAHVQRHATREQVLDLLRVRSVYHLKEADPTTWLVPRLDRATQAALLELQYDEYGAGDPNRHHAHLFALGLRACGLDDTYGAYVDHAPVEVLEQNNAMSLFGLHRRLRGAALGHLAAFEATSSLPSKRLAQGFERLGLPDQLVEYYREHAVADAAHEQLAVRTICGSLLAEHPELLDDVYLGAFSCLDLEDRFAGWMLDQWGVASAARTDASEDAA